MDNENDICIVKADGTWSTPLTIATEMVPRGERVFNLAAPRGIFYPGMVPTFEGSIQVMTVSETNSLQFQPDPGAQGRLS